MDIDECIEYIKEKHKGQTRKQGTSYYTHPLAVSNILKEKGFSLEYQVTRIISRLVRRYGFYIWRNRKLK